MKKRGQATLFIIVGIIIVALVVFFLVGRQTIFVPTATQENLRVELASIETEIEDCLSKGALEKIEQIGLQGGYLFTPTDTYRLFNGTTVSYLCYNIPDTTLCRNRMLTKSSMESELAENMQIESCVNGVLNKRRNSRSFTLVAAQEPEVKVTIAPQQVLVSLDYPLTIRSKKDDLTVSAQGGYSIKVDAPLGELYDVVLDIIDHETEFGYFDQLIYILAHKGRYIIEKKRPYPDIFYSIHLIEDINDPYVFQFYIEGEPST